MADDEGEVFGARRGWSLGRRLLASDSYGLLLLMILVSLIVSTLDLSSLGRLGELLRVVILGGTLAFALHTSQSKPRAYVACALLVGSATVLTVSFDAGSRAGRAIAAASALLLVIALLVTILRRSAEHLVVTGSSILAAICVYLLIGLAYSSVYGFVAAIGTSGLFVTVGDGTSTDRIYFSYITITTVGYGDLTMAGSPGRMIAATEGLLGQIYLVTVVALLVSNLGAARRRRPEPPAGDA
jgi:Ion channel